MSARQRIWRIIHGVVLCSFYMGALILLPFVVFAIEPYNAQEEGEVNFIPINHEEKKEPIWEEAFHHQIKTWMNEISAKESQFQQWANATYETYPFGPGSKQWIVLILRDNREIGYFIMGQASDQPIFELIEYGQSEQSILSTELRNNPSFLKEQFFYHGLLWAKREESTLVDLLTYEAYDHVPLEKVEPFWSGELVDAIHKQQEFNAGPQKEPILFLTSPEEMEYVSPAQFQQTSNYFYKAKLLPDVTSLYKVSSIHYWHELDQKQAAKLFIGLKDEGTRYLSYQYLAQLGSFSEMK